MKNVYPCKKVSHRKDILCGWYKKEKKNVTCRGIFKHREFVFFIPAVQNVFHPDFSVRT